MSVTGRIVNGLVVLPPGTKLPEGAAVMVETVEPVAQEDPLVAAVERLAKPRRHLPKDYALNHGHYTRGRAQEMRTVFADTFYFLALLDTKEKQHAQAARAARDPGLRLVTTEWVLTEFGDAYCHPADRADFVALYHSLANHPRIRIIPADTAFFQRGVEFYEQRKDKNWSLTDCLSFVSMREEGIKEALTGDKHFEQAGFTALLK